MRTEAEPEVFGSIEAVARREQHTRVRERYAQISRVATIAQPRKHRRAACWRYPTEGVFMSAHEICQRDEIGGSNGAQPSEDLLAIRERVRGDRLRQRRAGDREVAAQVDQPLTPTRIAIDQPADTQARQRQLYGDRKSVV